MRKHLNIPRFVRENIGWLTVLFLITGSFITVLVLGLFQQPPQLQKAGEFNMHTLAGEKIRTEEYQGHPIVLNFWAAWCPYCRTEMPVLEALHQEYKDRGLIVIGVHRSSTESKETALAFSRDMRISYLLVGDPNDVMFRHYSRSGNTVPLTVLIDKRGYVHKILIGPRSNDHMRSLVEELFK